MSRHGGDAELDHREHMGAYGLGSADGRCYFCPLEIATRVLGKRYAWRQRLPMTRRSRG